MERPVVPDGEPVAPPEHLAGEPVEQRAGSGRRRPRGAVGVAEEGGREARHVEVGGEDGAEVAVNRESASLARSASAVPTVVASLPTALYQRPIRPARPSPLETGSPTRARRMRKWARRRTAAGAPRRRGRGDVEAQAQGLRDAIAGGASLPPPRRRRKTSGRLQPVGDVAQELLRRLAVEELGEGAGGVLDADDDRVAPLADRERLAARGAGEVDRALQVVGRGQRSGRSTSVGGSPMSHSGHAPAPRANLGVVQGGRRQRQAPARRGGRGGGARRPSPRGPATAAARCCLRSVRHCPKRASSGLRVMVRNIAQVIGKGQAVLRRLAGPGSVLRCQGPSPPRPRVGAARGSRADRRARGGARGSG